MTSFSASNLVKDTTLFLKWLKIPLLYVFIFYVNMFSSADTPDTINSLKTFIIDCLLLLKIFKTARDVICSDFCGVKILTPCGMDSISFYLCPFVPHTSRHSTSIGAQIPQYTSAKRC